MVVRHLDFPCEAAAELVMRVAEHLSADGHRGLMAVKVSQNERGVVVDADCVHVDPSHFAMGSALLLRLLVNELRAWPSEEGHEADILTLEQMARTIEHVCGLEPAIQAPAVRH